MTNPSAYQPKPIDTSQVQLSPEIRELTEKLAENVHELWAAKRLEQGWKYGPQRNDDRREHPGLVAYSDLTESEKDYDRNTAMESIKSIVTLGYHIARGSKVHWLPRARCKIQEKDLIDQWNKELEEVFAPRDGAQITVSDVFRGYIADDRSKLILGVQVSYPEGSGSHIVKLGGEDVSGDFTGWKECVMKHGASSGILLGLRGQPLEKGRFAVVYQDGYQLFGTDPDTESPKPFEVAADWAITDSKPAIRSVERVLGQIFREMERCLYEGAVEGKPDHVANFYLYHLKKGNDQSAWQRWQDPKSPFWELRRDAIWLTSARHKPGAEQLPGYIDPFDYVRWAVQAGQIPKTLVGRSHGDLHGRNILVGVQLGEVEHPKIFDYGEMKDSNLLVWDFIKLESELKCRILPKLFLDEEARKALAMTAPSRRPDAAPGADVLSADERAVASRVERMEFAYHFETLLASLTRDIISRDAAEKDRPVNQRQITKHPAIDKALCLLYRLRQHAAFLLGFKKGRPERWRDEFYFATAIHGLLKAKWSNDEPQLEWAFIAAGVAAAQLSPANEITRLARQPPPAAYPDSPLPSHLVPLAWGHGLWQQKQSGQACELLQQAIEHFPAGVTLRSEYALCLAASGDLVSATEQVNRLRRLCHVFRDYEMLSRLGRIYKDSGDNAWASDPAKPDIKTFVERAHPGWQLYKEAFALYNEAFGFSHHYFPGINAATLALLTGQQEAQRELADEVLKICRQERIGDWEEQFWIYATEGEASLLVGKKEEAVTFYRAALATSVADKAGMVQVLYNQLCRLAWALGRASVKSILDELDRQEWLVKLSPGPFGNCGRKPKAKPRANR